MDSQPDRLDSWKEIATHFRRTVRTAQRWERACGMPVHRHGHRESSTVYAFRSELDAWWLSRSLSDTDSGRTQYAKPKLGSVATDRSAHELYEMARSEWDARTVDSIRRSAALAQHAIERDPQHAGSHAMFALAQVVLASYTPVPGDGPMENARQAALRAIEIDKATPDAHAALGLLYLSYDWHWARAESAFRRTTELEPQNATAWSWYGFFHLSRGDAERALVDMRCAEFLAPTSLIIKTHVAWVLYFARRYSEALDQLERTLALDPHFWRAYLNAAWCYMAIGRTDEAVRVIETAVALNDYPLLRTVLAQAYARAARAHEGHTVLAAVCSSAEHISPYYLAQARLAPGEHDQAGHLLLESVEAREWHLIFVRVAPGLDGLRGHPAYREVAARIAF